MYINNHDRCNWIRQKFEDPQEKRLPTDDIERAVKRLLRASKYDS
mgnify:CR=1 FL=1